MAPRKSIAPRPGSRPPSVRERFSAAFDGLIAEIQQDRSIVAAILCGSLSHDTVWDKSDIDLVLITADEKRSDGPSLTLSADGIHVHAFVYPRSEFRKTVESNRHNSFFHSFVAKGRVVFTHDPTIADLHARLAVIGDRDTQVQLLEAAVSAISSIDKARKWLVTRGDLDYAALWVLYAATPAARIEVVGRKLLADREVLPQAATLNPELFRVIYTDLLNVRKTRASVEGALETIERYIRERARTLFALVLEHLREAGEARACTELDDHFSRHYGIATVTPACEYLASEGIIGKASLPVRLTKTSNVQVQELAFFSLESRFEDEER
jgi:uncharacterized protein